MVFKLIQIPFTIVKWVFLGLVFFILVVKIPHWVREMDDRNVVEVLQNRIKCLVE